MPNLDNEKSQDKLQKIIDYYANPLDDRTIKMFCDDEDMSEATFRRYRKDFRAEIFQNAEARRKVYQSELRSFGYKALVGRARKSDNAAKLLFQLLGDLVERTENINSYESAEQKRERVAELLRNAGLEVTLSKPVPPQANKSINKPE